MTLQATRFNGEAGSAGAEALVVQEDQEKGAIVESGQFNNLDIIPEFDVIYWNLNRSNGRFVDASTKQEYDSIVALIHSGEAYYGKFDGNTLLKSYDRKDQANGYLPRIDLFFSLITNVPQEEDSPVINSISLSFTSAVQFKKYKKLLDNNQYAINKIATKLTTSDQQNKFGQKYKRIEFEAFDLKTKQPLGIKTY